MHGAQVLCAPACCMKQQSHPPERETPDVRPKLVCHPPEWQATMLV